MQSTDTPLVAGAAVLLLAGLCAAADAQLPDLPMPPTQMPNGGIPGMAPLPTQQGTWVYPVRNGLHTDMVEGHAIGASHGIDGDILARSSLQAVYTAAGDPPTCPGGGGADIRGRSRILAMEVWTGSGSFLGGQQESRLVVNQELSRAVLYLHGDVHEWVPGPNFCDDGAYVEAGSGRGMLRMEYETVNHVAPLNFMAFPRAGEVDISDLEESCEAMRDLAVEAYQDMNRRWNLVTHDFSGPLDWSTITPVEDGYADGEHASFGDGLFNTGDVVEAAATASDAVSLGASLANAFSRAPSVAASGAAGVGQWVVMQAMEPVLNAAGIPTMSPADAMMAMAMMGHHAYGGSGEPRAREVADHALRRLPDPDGPFEGVDADYIMHTLFEACDGLSPETVLTGYAGGHFSWPGGTVPLSGRGLAPGEPAATANGPVQSGSLSDALALAQSMGAEIPDMAEIQAAMPPGMSLEALPAPMAGRAGGGGMLASNAPEWTISYTVELVDDGERIAAHWFDPRR
jgi:hypothetical protein